MAQTPSVEDMLERERIANRKKHWVRAVTACNSRCIFCLDSDTPRNVYLPVAEVERELRRGREELGADKVILSGGEASLHPKFVDLIRYGKSIGYDRVQTVTNGYMYADPAFYRSCIDAGLGEITFSLHGHTAELHDDLTRMKGAFHRLMKAMIRALHDPKGPIVNVDVVINKQNVGVLDKIIELCISVGVTEFDLLHVIPQAAAFDHRDELFYDVREHMDVLHKVFRLNRHPRFVIWTNRFPVSYLEGLEDLIQDPHKMLDEVNGRRWQVRRYLDIGEPLDCRQPERCVHCFIEPYCTTQDRVIADLTANRWEVWSVGRDVNAEWPGERAGAPGLPYGCRWWGVDVDDVDALGRVAVVDGYGLEARVRTAGPLPAAPAHPLRLIADSDAHCEAWLADRVAPGADRVAPGADRVAPGADRVAPGADRVAPGADRVAPGADRVAPGVPPGVEVEIWLNRSTAPWLLANRDRLDAVLDRVRVHQPSYEHLKDASENDVRDPASFFRDLGLRVRTSGLPACAAPGTELVEPIRRLPRELIEADTGRLAIHDLARFHVREGYLARSERCRGCRLTERCDGAHVNFVRDQGLKQLQPLTEGAWADDADAQLRARWPEPPQRVLHGRKPEPAHASLPGFAQPTDAPPDPLSVIAQDQQAKRAQRLERAKAEFKKG